ncbi:hypothetical protein ACTFIW_012108 [Dictyostelium discoideum]
MSFSALILVGDGKGRVGYGFAKANELIDAIRKGGELAKKNMISVLTEGSSIPHDVKVKWDGALIFICPAQQGTGIIAGSKVRAVLEFAGIKDVIAKSLGASNPIKQVRATFKALQSLTSREAVLEARRKRKRVGRGMGLGKTAGRGHKGMDTKKDLDMKVVSFLYRKLPQRGFSTVAQPKGFSKRVLLRKKVTIEAIAFSKSALEKLQSNGISFSTKSEVNEFSSLSIFWLAIVCSLVWPLDRSDIFFGVYRVVGYIPVSGTDGEKAPPLKISMSQPRQQPVRTTLIFLFSNTYHALCSSNDGNHLYYSRAEENTTSVCYANDWNTRSATFWKFLYSVEGKLSYFLLFTSYVSSYNSSIYWNWELVWKV